jgi:signal transduction histidine kinase
MSSDRLRHTLMNSLDPRHSLVAGIIWLTVALAASFAITASLWAGGVAREIVLQQHVRRLALETDQLGSDLDQAVSARLLALRAAPTVCAPGPAMLDCLTAHFPGLDWLAFANADGIIVAVDKAGNDPAAHAVLPLGANVTTLAWFTSGLLGPWIGSLADREPSTAEPLLGTLAAPLADANGRIMGVMIAGLNWHWANQDVRRLSATLDSRGSAQTLILDDAGNVLVGPGPLRNRPWPGAIEPQPPPIEPAPETPFSTGGPPRFERLPDGQTVLVARAAVRVANAVWQVQLSEPKKQVYQRANALATQILWISACLAVATALLGALGARHLTDRLKRLTRSAAAVGRNETVRIEVPTGRDEVAQLAAVFAKILDDLRQERGELVTLSTELERRVALRTREVQRLAEEARYAAVVRERLKIARELHDTLAHSMMAMLSEIRLLRKLAAHDPTAIGEELARAEQVAHDGLNEARTAITQMRVNTVRDTGLGAALAQAFDRLLDRTGLIGTFRADPDAARVGDERAETLFRMAEEVLRNIERHAMATRADMSLEVIDDGHLRLRISDDGVGFDPQASLPGHFGLVGLREQAQLIDGDLHIDSTPNRGTTLTVTLRTAPEELQPLADEALRASR